MITRKNIAKKVEERMKREHISVISLANKLKISAESIFLLGDNDAWIDLKDYLAQCLWLLSDEEAIKKTSEIE